MQTITILAGQPQDFNFIENDILRSVAQNISLIGQTKKGTVPFYREFGIPMSFIDKPAPVARTLLLSEMTEAIDLFEPRAELVSVSFLMQGEKSYPKLEVRLKDASE
ncbi:MAG: hypothetical protein E7671_00505 [Ruminococcaceae bacterium]|nr:hypothetical protein [Oscillospiraceae bacterium]